jgi:hypothetical protein
MVPQGIRPTDSDLSQLIDPVGPEANNRRAGEFEDQLVAFAAALGWEARCRNIDMFASTGGQSAGVDVLLAFEDPQLGRHDGIIGEAKIRHPLAPAKGREDIAVLSRKLVKLAPSVSKIAQDLVVTNTGLLVYDATPFDPRKHAHGLAAIHQDGLSRGLRPRHVLVLGPDTLVGLADCLEQKPTTRFYWPPFEQREGRWSRSAPPLQVAVGMLAFRAGRTTTLWLRDELEHDEDFIALMEIAWEWRINIDRVVCSTVKRDQYMAIVDRWREQAKRSHNREVGRLPESIEARGLSFQSLTPFADRWGKAA